MMDSTNYGKPISRNGGSRAVNDEGDGDDAYEHLD